MSHAISEELALVINLRNAAIEHKKLCNKSCDVSLGLLKQAARNIARWVKTWERDEANKYISEMPFV